MDERGNDALVEVLDSSDRIIARADHPERRTGTRRAAVLAESASLRVRITGQEHAAAVGTARIEVFDLASLEARPDCLTILKALATGDADYAAGKEIATAVSTSSGNARETFLRTVAAYASAEKALDSRAD
ncbi:MAG: hypothetical protein JOZ34_07975, partial [Gammaproteobacteria bacterium]|nr:hypothetical protein [Gammaproteobacteria bacterium]